MILVLEIPTETLSVDLTVALISSIISRDTESILIYSTCLPACLHYILGTGNFLGNNPSFQLGV